MTLVHKKIPSIVGELTLVANDKGLVAILWENDSSQRVKLEKSLEQQDHPILILAEKQLQDYFTGNLKQFTVPLDFQGTQFQKDVWAALLNIPYGETRTYSEIAKSVGRPKAVRAVGAANGRNPISIIAACHRVIGTNGTLTGFAGGLETKAALLHLESQ